VGGEPWWRLICIHAEALSSRHGGQGESLGVRDWLLIISLFVLGGAGGPASALPRRASCLSRRKACGDSLCDQAGFSGVSPASNTSRTVAWRIVGEVAGGGGVCEVQATTAPPLSKFQIKDPRRFSDDLVVWQDSTLGTIEATYSRPRFRNGLFSSLLKGTSHLPALGPVASHVRVVSPTRVSTTSTGGSACIHGTARQADRLAAHGAPRIHGLSQTSTRASHLLQHTTVRSDPRPRRGRRRRRRRRCRCRRCQLVTLLLLLPAHSEPSLIMPPHAPQPPRRRAHKPASASSAASMSRPLVFILLAGLVAGQRGGLDNVESWSLRSAIDGLLTTVSLCATSNCFRSRPLPERPGGRYAKFGPYKTRLVQMSRAQTRRYGFDGAVDGLVLRAILLARVSSATLRTLIFESIIR